jgi:hypothetical protein
MSDPFDCNSDREVIPHPFPGKSIEALKGIHSGAVALLFNGPSLKPLKLFDIKVPLIGMNRTYVGNPGYLGPNPQYLCVVDQERLNIPETRDHPGLINGSNDMQPLGYRATYNYRMFPFSFDLYRDGYVAAIPCTTGHLALQVAVYMGFTRLYCLGLDLGGGHFDDSPGSHSYQAANRFHLMQAPLLKDRGIKVYVCDAPDSACTAFPHVGFEDLIHET